MERRSPTRRVVGDLLGLIWRQRRWWLLPLVVVGLLVSAALTLGSSAAAPFVYSLF